MLKLCNIVKNYPTATTTVQALRGISLEFRENEFVAILGPSGCGKTTMLNIIGGLDRYTSGDLVIGGVSTATFDDLHWDAYRNATIGFVFQSYNLIPHLTVLENVELALSLVGEKKKIRRAKAIAALNRVGMAGEINKRPNQLSGGQMQRVAIARAIVNSPKIILADEPTGALDSELSVQVMDILQEISRSCLVIMVTHNAELAATYATRTCRFKDGQLVEDTNPYGVGGSSVVPTEKENNVAENAAYTANNTDEAVNCASEGASNDNKYADFCSNGATDLLTTDTLSAQDNEPVQEEAAKEEGVHEEAHTVQPATDVNYDELSQEEQGEPKKKKVSNRKRKKQMRKMHVDTREVFEKLGLNSLSKSKKKIEKKNKTFKPTSMNAGMAFGLSVRNLVSKFRRSFLTMFAGSIGIIGLGLVLSISNGFNMFVENMQRDMLVGVPLCIYEYNISSSAVMDLMTAMGDIGKVTEERPELGDEISVTTKAGDSTGMAKMIASVIDSFFKNANRNELTEDFDAYIKDMPEGYASAVSHYYGVRYNLVSKSLQADGTYSYKDASQQPETSSVITIASSILGASGVQPEYWQMLAGDESFMMDSYEFVGENSRYPQNKNELLLCVGDDNTIDQKLLDEFGISMYVLENGVPQEVEQLTADFFIGKTLRLVSNNAYFEHDDELNLYYEPNKDSQDNLNRMYNESSVELNIVGVIRPKADAAGGYVSSAICYTPELAQYVVDEAYMSNVAVEQRALIDANPKTNSTVFLKNSSLYGEAQTQPDAAFETSASWEDIVNMKLSWTSYLKAIGATKAPTFVKVYPTTYDQRVDAGGYINEWNTKHGGKAGYFDVSEMIVYNLVMIIDLVSIILVAVASISLVVSTVMIGVITSNSVIERTREIGILRSLGARKRDIRNVFVAETTLIGLACGLIGIILTYILCPIINLVIGAVAGVESLLHFHPLHAFILVVLSLALTVISGTLPAIGASRKNVVDALRVD